VITARWALLVLPIVFAGAAGCAGARHRTLDAMVGEDIDVAIAALGQPSEILDLADGRRSYVWQRIFTYDYGTPSFSLEQWRYDSTYFFEDDVHAAPARLCSTRMEVSFDLRIESWGYGCETIVVERAPWPTPEDPGNRIRIPH